MTYSFKENKGNKMRIYTLLLYLFTSVLFVTPLTIAAEFEADDNVHISNIHVIDGDLYTWGEIITIDGEIKGDLIGGGESVTLNGLVENSTIIGANKFSHSGDINGSLRLFANNAVIDGAVKRSGLFFCNELKFGKNAVIGKDVYIYGGNIDIAGTIHGDVTINSGPSVLIGTGITLNREGVYISGTIDGDLTIHAKEIHIVPPALIKGDFKYISDNQANIDINSGVTILGNTTWDLPEKIENDEKDTLFLATAKAGSKLLAAFLFGLLLMVLCKNYISSMVFQLQERFAISAAVGFISFAVLVIFVIILILTLLLLITGLALIAKGEAIGGTIILALSTIMIPISSVTIVTISTMIYSGKIIMALLLGFTIVSKLKSNPAYLSKSQLFLGLLIMYIIFALPYIGTLLFVIISIIGVGAIILGIKDCNKGLNKNKISDQAGI